jgi:hypothetical protein
MNWLMPRAVSDGVAASGKKEHGAEDRADTRSPTESECEPEEKATPDAGLRGFGAEVDVAIEPAREGRTEETNYGEREKMRSAESGEERGMAEERRYTQGDEDHAKDHADAEIELDERADEVEAEEENQGSGDGSEESAVLEKEGTDSAGRGAKRYEHDGKTGNEGERGREKAGTWHVALAELLHADAGEHGDVAGHERQDTRRKEGNQPGEKGSSERNVGHVRIIPLIVRNPELPELFPKPAADLLLDAHRKKKRQGRRLKRIDDR